MFALLDRKAGGPVLDCWIYLNEAQHGNIAPRLGYPFITLKFDRRLRVRLAKGLVEL